MFLFIDSVYNKNVLRYSSVKTVNSTMLDVCVNCGCAVFFQRF